MSKVIFSGLVCLALSAVLPFSALADEGLLEFSGVVSSAPGSGGTKSGGSAGLSFQTQTGDGQQGSFSGTLGGAGNKVIGSFAMDIGHEKANANRGTHFAMRAGVTASPHVSQVGMQLGLNHSHNGMSTTVTSRLPVMGGIVYDRKTGASLYATGLRLESVVALTKNLEAQVDAELDYLVGESEAENDAMPQTGAYASQGLALKYKLRTGTYIKAQGMAESLRYTTSKVEKDGSTTESFATNTGFTGMVTMGGAL
jgi:hypothetical protein